MEEATKRSKPMPGRDMFYLRLLNFVEEHTGLSPRAAKDIVDIVFLFFEAELRLGRVAYLKDLVDLLPYRQAQPKIVAKVNDYLKQVLASKEKIPNLRRKRIAYELRQEERAEFEAEVALVMQQKRYLWEPCNFSRELAAYEEEKTYKSFICYLRTGFVHGYDWTVPCGKQQVIPHREVVAALSYMRKFNPKDYAELYSLWLKGTERDLFINTHKIRAMKIKYGARECLRAIVVCLTHPGLIPQDMDWLLKNFKDRKL